MMTLDGAIAHSKEMAKKLRNMTSITDGKPYDECIACAEDHEQLASWLEELKRYKSQKVLIKVNPQDVKTLKRILQASQFGIAYPDTQYEVVPMVNGGQADRWIPVSERLPEEKISPNTNDFVEVLCTTVFGDVRTYKYGTPIGHEQAHFWYGFGIFDNEVIAWRPLPEPYKESEGKT